MGQHVNSNQYTKRLLGLSKFLITYLIEIHRLFAKSYNGILKIKTNFNTMYVSINLWTKIYWLNLV